MPSGTVTSKGTRPSTSRTITAESVNASGLASKARIEIARGRGLGALQVLLDGRYKFAPSRRQLSALQQFARGSASDSSPTPSTGRVLSLQNSHIAHLWAQGSSKSRTPPGCGSSLEKV